MKKLLSMYLVAVFIFLCSFSALASDAQKTTEKDIRFRDFEWMTSRAEVIERIEDEGLVMGVDFSSSGDSIGVFGQEIAGYDCSILYKFNTDDELISGGYVIDELHTNEQQYYLDYLDLAEKLESVYGEPSIEIEKWYDDFYEGEENKQGMAIITGDLAEVSTWYDNDGNRVYVMCHGDNYECKTIISYSVYNVDDYKEDKTAGL